MNLKQVFGLSNCIKLGGAVINQGGGAAADVNILPSDIASLLFDYNPEEGTFQDAAGTIQAVAGDPVWRLDEPTNGYNLLTTNNDYRPLLTLDELNGKPTLTFDGVNDGMQANFPRTLPETVFIVFKQTGAGVTREILNTYVAANATHDVRITSTADRVSFGSNVTVLEIAAADIDNYHIWSYIQNDDNSAVHRDGTRKGAGDCAAVTANGITVACWPAWLTSGTLQARCANLSVARILGFSAVLSESEHNQIGKYLADYYGLTFSLSLHSYDDNAYPTTVLNRTGGGTYVRTSAFARKIYSTTATRLYLEIYNDTYDTWPQYSGIGIRINGADYVVVDPGAMGTVIKTVNLPAGSKTIEIINGFQHEKITEGPKGTYAVGVSFNAAFTVVAGDASPRLLIYGDSIAVGAAATGLPLTAWPQIVRNTYADSVLVEAWSARQFWDDANDATARTNFANLIAAQSPAEIWLAIGYNDRALITSGAHWVNEAGFAAAYGDLLDKLNAALPTAVIYAQTPIITGSEGVGDNIHKVRSAIATAQSTRGAFCTLVDGTTLVSVGNLSDGVHPTTTGQAEYAASVKTVLGIT